MLRSTLSLLLLLVTFAANSAAVTVDFEEFSGSLNLGDSGPWAYTNTLSNGFEFSGDSETASMVYGNTSTNNFFAVCTIAAYCGNSYGPAMSFEASGSQLFSLYSFDLIVSSDSCVHVYGNTSGTADLQLDAVNNGFTECVGKNYGEAGIWLETGSHTVSLTTAWTDLSAVEIHTHDTSTSDLGYMGLDNVVASIVPIPAAGWLFGSALAGLGWIRRKQAA
jgi:hypothetical protein